jgi:hypothetical protein
MIIQDGVGTGRTLKVDDENMAHVLSTAAELPHHTNLAHGTAYTMDIDGIQTDGANYWLAVIKNTDDDDMVVTSITGWVPSFSNTQIYEAYIGGTFTYATNGTAVVPTNCNAGSGKTATGNFYVNDGSGNITTVVAGSVVGRYIFGVEASRWIPDADWIIPKNQCFMLWSDLAEKLTGYISFYYHNNQWV